MKKGGFWLMILGPTAALASMGAGVTYHTERPGRLCGLPDYDYTHGAPSQPVSVFSLDPVPLEATQASTPGAAHERMKYFRLSQATVSNDHCSLSRVALTLHDSGEWTLSMRADQNPWMTGPNNEVSTEVQLPGAVSALTPPIPNLGKETNSLKRNLFIVKVRCYADFPNREPQPVGPPGRPVLLELPTQCFWVQRGNPYDFWDKKSMPEIGRYFDVIDRVEVELSYR